MDIKFFWQTDKVQLRALQMKDAQKKRQEWFDTNTRRYLEYQLDLPPVSPEEYTEQLKDACEFRDTGRSVSFAIDNAKGEFVGWINFFKGETRHGNFSFGVSIFPKYQRRGYAEDAVRLILHYGFNEMRFHKCSSECLDINKGSIQLHKKLGFIKEGHRRKMVYMNGQYHDIILFGLLEDEFRKSDV